MMSFGSRSRRRPARLSSGGPQPMQGPNATLASSVHETTGRLGVLIVEYRDPDGALRIAAALGTDPSLEVIVISTGPSALTEPGRGVRTVHLPSNPGFGAALNRGAEALSDGVTHMLLCNTDIHLSRDAALRLWEYARTTGWAQLSPMIIGPAGLVEWDGGHIDFLWIQVVHEGLGHWPRSGPGVRPTTFVTGACMMVRRDVWKSIGGMKEDFFLYGEDVDFSMRLQRAGLIGGVVRRIQVVHETSATVGRDSPLQMYLMTRNGIRIFRDWSPHFWGRLGCWLVVPARMLWRLLRNRASLRQLAWIFKGLMDAVPASSHHRFRGRAVVPRS